MADDGRRQVQVRLPTVLLAAIDERAERFKLSRNEWIVKALQRIVDMPAQITTRQERF